MLNQRAPAADSSPENSSALKQVSRRPLTLTDVVTPVRILHHRELFLVGNQSINKNFGSCSEHCHRPIRAQSELAGQAAAVRHRRARAIVGFVVLRQTHVTL
jgi:hypothetical protein